MNSIIVIEIARRVIIVPQPILTPISPPFPAVTGGVIATMVIAALSLLGCVEKAPQSTCFSDEAIVGQRPPNEQQPEIVYKPYSEIVEEADPHAEHSHLFGSEPRSSHWPTVRDNFVKEHPECAACGSKDELNVHHIQPFHLKPELELDPSNLIVLCREHHFDIGHHRNWSKSNPNVRADSERFLKAKKTTVVP